MRAGALAAIVGLTACMTAASTAPVPPSVLLQRHFDALEAAFEQLATDRAVAMVELSPTTRLFAAAIESNRVIVSLMRTNAKGILINEYVEGRGAVRAYRSLAGQRWYAQMQQTLVAHRGVISDRYAKTYLLWAQPIVLASTVGGRRFSGVVAAKIDLLACLDSVARICEYPFRVTARGVTVYSHRWEAGLDHDEAEVVIPGMSQVLVSELRRPGREDEVLVTDFPAAGTEGAEGAAAGYRPAKGAAAGSRLRVRPLLFYGMMLGAVVYCIRRRLRWRAIVHKVHEETAV